MVQATIDLGAIAPGFADPVRDSQAVFRATLAAMAHPGRIISVTAGLEAPSPLNPATAAICLSLLDYDTPVWLDERARGATVSDYLRFHCGAPIAQAPEDARFAIIAGPLPALASFPAGSDAYPDRSATLILQVERLAPHGALRLRGPGIDGEMQVGVEPLSSRLLQEWAANNALYPRGLDLIVTAGRSICAFPRTTRMEI